MAHIDELPGIVHGGFLLELSNDGSFGVGGAVYGVDIHDFRSNE
jgi:hypothetical protein